MASPSFDQSESRAHHSILIHSALCRLNLKAGSLPWTFMNRTICSIRHSTFRRQSVMPLLEMASWYHLALRNEGLHKTDNVHEGMCIFSSSKSLSLPVPPLPPATATRHRTNCIVLLFSFSRWIWMHRQPGLGTKMERVGVSGVSGFGVLPDLIEIERHGWVSGFCFFGLPRILGEFARR